MAPLVIPCQHIWFISVMRTFQPWYLSPNPLCSPVRPPNTPPTIESLFQGSSTAKRGRDSKEQFLPTSKHLSLSLCPFSEWSSWRTLQENIRRTYIYYMYARLFSFRDPASFKRWVHFPSFALELTCKSLPLGMVAASWASLYTRIEPPPSPAPPASACATWCTDERAHYVNQSLFAFELSHE